MLLPGDKLRCRISRSVCPGRRLRGAPVVTAQLCVFGIFRIYGLRSARGWMHVGLYVNTFGHRWLQSCVYHAAQRCRSCGCHPISSHGRYMQSWYGAVDVESDDLAFCHEALGSYSRYFSYPSITLNRLHYTCTALH